MVDLNKNKDLIYKTNLIDVSFTFTYSAGAMIWRPVFNFRFENIQQFRETLYHWEENSTVLLQRLL